MNIMYYAIGFIVIILALPYLKIFIKRLNMFLIVKHVCKKNNLDFVAVRFFWIFSGIKNGKCDFYIVGDNIIFRVKLAGSV